MATRRLTPILILTFSALMVSLPAAEAAAPWNKLLRYFETKAAQKLASQQQQQRQNRLRTLQENLGVPVHNFSHEANADIRSLQLAVLSRYYTSGSSSHNFIYVPHNNHLAKLLGADCSLVGRYQGPLDHPQLVDETIKTYHQYMAGAQTGFGPRTYGVGLDQNQKVFIFVEHVEGQHLNGPGGSPRPPPSRGIVDAVDQGIERLVREHNTLPLWVFPDDVVCPTPQNHPLGFSLTATVVDWHPVPADSIEDQLQCPVFRTGLMVTAMTRYNVSYEVRQRAPSSQQANWTPFWKDLFNRTYPNEFKTLLNYSRQPDLKLKKKMMFGEL